MLKKQQILYMIIYQQLVENPFMKRAVKVPAIKQEWEGWQWHKSKNNSTVIFFPKYNTNIQGECVLIILFSFHLNLNISKDI